MADVRINALATTATTSASDDFMALDGTTNGTRKMSAATPKFLTSVAVPTVTSAAGADLNLITGTSGVGVVLTSATGAITAASTGSHVFGTTNTVTMAAGVLTATAQLKVGSGTTLGLQIGDAGTVTVPSTPRAIFIAPDAVVGQPTIAVTGAAGGYGAGVDFVSGLSDATTTIKSMGKIVADGAAAWSSTASTQDADMTFWTSLNGTLTKGMTLASDQSVTIVGALTTGANINLPAGYELRYGSANNRIYESSSVINIDAGGATRLSCAAATTTVTNNLAVSGTGSQTIGGVASRLVLQGGTADTPASAAAAGTAGSVVWDASYLYVCTATNTWKRSAIATW